MARFSYKCSEHGDFTVSLDKRLKTHLCPKCGQPSKTVYKGGSVQVMERLDNGLMARAVERLHNAEDLTNEIAEADSKRFNENNPDDSED